MEGKQGRKGDTGPPGPSGDIGDRGPQGIIYRYICIMYYNVIPAWHVLDVYVILALQDQKVILEIKDPKVSQETEGQEEKEVIEINK